MSIDVKELRIANLTYFGKNVCEVSKIYRSGYYCTSLEGVDYGSSVQSSYKPIPLTEEWLIKFGFEYFGAGYNDFDIDGSWVCNHLQEFSLTLFSDNSLAYDCLSKWLDIEYVHQLQNLYYALTGEELKLKEDGIN